MAEEPRKVKETRSAYERLFDSEDGQAVLDDLKKVCHWMSNTFVPSSTHETAFREGQRSVLLHILYNRLDRSQQNDLEQALKEMQNARRREQSERPEQSRQPEQSRSQHRPR